MRTRRFVQKALSTPPHRLVDVLCKASLRFLKEKSLRRRAYRERHGMSDAQLARSIHLPRSDSKATAELSDLPFNQTFFVHPKSRNAFVKCYENSFPHLKPRTIAAADSLLEHEFDLLGSGKVKLGDKIDWHCDFKSGYRWKPGTYFNDYQRIRLEDRSDVKVTRELSRFQHFTVLGKAYWLTQNEKYAREFVVQIEDWVCENPPMFSINWDCAMDVAIRAVNWVWGYYFFADSASVSEDFKKRFAKSLLSHGRYIWDTVEYYEAPVDGCIRRLNSNHYLSDLAGLIFIAIACPFFKESSRWLEHATRELFIEIEEQVYPSGVDYEHSVSYHRLVLELFLFPFLLLRMNGHEVPNAAWRRLERMFEYVLYYTKSDGTHPLVGDADDGRLVILEDGPIDSHRYLLSLGAVLFGRDDLKNIGAVFNETCLWALGPSSVSSFDALSASSKSLNSKGFSDAQFFVMRAADAYLFVDAANTGIRDRGSHDHNDRLSFELHSRGTTFFSDSGAYVYSTDPQLRNRFRSTRSHNTIRVDEIEQNTLGEGVNLWVMGNEANPRVHHWEVSAQRDVLRVSHTGYQRLADPVVHFREFVFEKEPVRWTITDDLTGEKVHDLEWYFHLGIGVTTITEDADLLECLYRGLRLRGAHGDVLYFRLKTHVPGLFAESVEDWISRSYGLRERALTLRIHGTVQLPLRVEFEICQ